MNMTGDTVYILVLLIMAVVILIAWIAGSSTGNTSRMELVAAVQTARSEVGWTYERYRLESLRIDWLALTPQARQEYVRSWGRPKWALAPPGAHEEYPNRPPQSQ